MNPTHAKFKCPGRCGDILRGTLNNQGTAYYILCKDCNVEGWVGPEYIYDPNALVIEPEPRRYKVRCPTHGILAVNLTEDEARKYECFFVDPPHPPKEQG